MSSLTRTNAPMSKPPTDEDISVDRKSARARILAAAAELFYREGVRAVGIDAVIAKAGVAKMSLYRAFPSKDDLVAAFLAEQNAGYWQWWESTISRHPGDPRGQLLAIFRGLAKRTSNPAFRGCPFVNTAVEFPEPDHPGRAIAIANKAELRRRLGRLTAALGVSDPALLADHLLLLMEGAYCAGSVMGPTGPSAAAATAAEALINSAIGGPSPAKA